MGRVATALSWASTAVLLVAAAFEAERAALGADPTRGSLAESIVSVAAALAILAAFALAVLAAFRPFPGALPVLAPAIGAYALALLFTYDDSRPTRRRYADGFPWWWLALLAAVSAGAGALIARNRRTGVVALPVLLLLLFGTLVGTGH